MRILASGCKNVVIQASYEYPSAQPSYDDRTAPRTSTMMSIVKPSHRRVRKIALRVPLQIGTAPAAIFAHAVGLSGTEDLRTSAPAVLTQAPTSDSARPTGAHFGCNFATPCSRAID